MTSADSSACSVGSRLAACVQTSEAGPSMTAAVDLLAAVRGQAVQEDGIAARERHQLRRDPVAARAAPCGRSPPASLPIETHTSV